MIKKGAQGRDDENGTGQNKGTAETTNGVIITAKVFCKELDSVWSQEYVSNITIEDESIWHHLKTNEVLVAKLQDEIGSETIIDFGLNVMIESKAKKSTKKACVEWMERAVDKLKEQISNTVKQQLPCSVSDEIKDGYKYLTFSEFCGKTFVTGPKIFVDRLFEQTGKQLQGEERKRTTQKFELKSGPKYEMLKTCDNVTTWRANNPDADLDFEDKDMCVIVQCSTKAEKAWDDIAEIIKDITVSSLENLDQEMKQFIQQKYILQYLNEQLNRLKMGKVFDIGGPEHLVVAGENEAKIKESVEQIFNFVKKETYAVTKAGIRPSGVRFKELRRCLTTEYKHKLCISWDKHNRENPVKILCTADIFEDVDATMKAAMSRDLADIKELEFWVDPGEYKYITTTKFDELGNIASIHEVDVDMKKSLTADEDKVCLIFQGQESDTRSMLAHMQRNILKGVITKSEKISDAACQQFLREKGEFFYKTLSEETNCVIDIKDVDEGLHWKIAGVNVFLSDNIECHEDPIIVLGSDNENKFQDPARPSSSETIYSRRHNVHTLPLVVPYRKGNVVVDAFIQHTEVVFETLCRRKCKSAAIEIQSQFYTDQNQGDIIEMILKGLRKHCKNHPVTSVTQITFFNLSNDFMMYGAKKILEHSISEYSDEIGNEQVKWPLVTFTGAEKDIRKLENYSVKRKIEEARQIPPETKIPDEGKRVVNKEIEEEGNLKEKDFKMKKETDSRITVLKTKLLLEKCPESIGLLNAHYCTGTCFRIGKNYIATNIHIMQDITEQISPMNWDERQERFDNLVSVIFNYTDENKKQDLTQYRLHWEPKYIIEELDFVVMELKDTEKNVPSHLRLSLACNPVTLTLIGHPNGDVQYLDTECQIVDPDDVKVKDAKMYAKLVYESGDAYDNIGNRNFIVCHTSSDFGSSGSPAFSFENGEPVVVGVLKSGTPYFYPDLTEDGKQRYPKSYMFEQVISMKAIAQKMENENTKLYEELFSTKANDGMEIN